MRIGFLRFVFPVVLGVVMPATAAEPIAWWSFDETDRRTAADLLVWVESDADQPFEFVLRPVDAGN